MAVRDLLFEIGTEEIPARFMPRALRELGAFAAEELSASSIAHGDILVKCTPRRMIITVSELSERQADSVETEKGPLREQAFDAQGRPTKAAEGFARSRGISVEELTVKKVGKAEYAVAEVRKEGRAAEEVLPEILERVIRRLSFPKSMFWADPTVRFARPVRWIVALFGSEPLAVTFGGVTSGVVSRGHRFMGSDCIKIESLSQYERVMRENCVIIDPEERRGMILDGVAQLEKELGAKVDVEETLLEENVHLVEYPVVFYGSFDKSFLDIPEEVLTLSMAKNQRYFPVRSENGRFMPYFIGVSNNRAKDMRIVREGNERVLRARLYDAAFFWKEDLQKSLDSLTEKLKTVTYQARLGTVYDKVQRVRDVALWLTSCLGRDELREYVGRAASIAKADLVTNMVCEFADVQGVIGREYARKAGEPEEVALAVYEQYLPRYAGDELPSGFIGAVLGLAERAYIISAIYKIGLEPTSSQDPYGLRRAARCINEIIWGLQLDVDTSELIKKASESLSLDMATEEKISEFLRQRLQVQLRERGLGHEVTTLAVQTIPTKPLQVLRMAETLQKSSCEAWFSELITTAVRVKNILTKAGEIKTEVDPSKFTAEAERALYSLLSRVSGEARDAVGAYDWEKLASVLAGLTPVIAEFFADVLVMDENLEVRANRLTLLSKCQEFFLLVGDFSLLK